MKKIIIFVSVVLFGTMISCTHPKQISFLDVSGLSYPDNSLTIVKGLTEADMVTINQWGMEVPSKFAKYKTRVLNKAPWMSVPFYGATVGGARNLDVAIETVKVNGEVVEAKELRKNVSFMGDGVFIIPYENDIPEGIYLVSLRISNISGSAVASDCFTIKVYSKENVPEK